MSEFTLEQLSDKGMPLLMQLLVSAAHGRKKITYKEVAQQFRKVLGKPFLRVSPLNIGYVAGNLMYRIKEVAPKAPPINTLVINGQTKLPGGGAGWFVRHYLKKITYSKLNNRAKRELLQPVFEDVYAFGEWEKVARLAFGIKINIPTELPSSSGERDGKEVRLGFGGPAESAEHLRLKLYVQKHPRKFGAPIKCKKGFIEKKLESHDEIDVWFMAPGKQLAVEVKSTRSLEGDLRRGIFQCVKYRAVLGAQARWEFKSKLPTIRARLVSEKPLAADLLKLAKLLDVEIQVITPLGIGR
jgi:hypothetical protein